MKVFQIALVYVLQHHCILHVLVLLNKAIFEIFLNNRDLEMIAQSLVPCKQNSIFSKFSRLWTGQEASPIDQQVKSRIFMIVYKPLYKLQLQLCF